MCIVMMRGSMAVTGRVACDGAATTGILFAVTSGDTGGAQEHVLRLCEHFRGSYRVTLVAGSEGHLTESARQLGVRVCRIAALGRNRPSAADFSVVRELVALIKGLAPVLVSCHSTKAGFWGRVAARLAGAPAVFTAHGWGFSDGVSGAKRWVLLHGERVAARWARKIICVSEHDRQLALRHGVGFSEQLLTILNGVPHVDVPLARAGEGFPVRIAMVARFSPPKDHFLLLEALAGLVDLDWELWLVGGGELQQRARAEARRLGLCGRVRFLGVRHDVPQLLSRCHLFVLASRWEGLPLTVLEAMRAGLPVVASDVGGVSEAVVEGKTGFLVPRGDVLAMRERLRLLIQDPGLRARFGAAGRDRWEKKFRLERMLKETEAVYREVLECWYGWAP